MSSSLTVFFVAFLFFIWQGESTRNQIYFMTFIIKLIHTIFYFHNKIIIIYRCFQHNLISMEECFTNFFDNFVCFMINYGFYFVTVLMHYTIFISVFRRSKVNCNNWIFYVSDFLRLFKSFKYGLISSKYSLIWLIGFCFYYPYFHIWYNYCYKNYF